MKVSWVTRKETDRRVLSKVIRTRVVLDIGPGIRPQAYFRPRIHICVEPYLPYIERLRADIRDESPYVFMNCTWEQAMSTLPDKSVDSTFAMDVIEHFEKDDGLKFLKEAERISRRQIIVFTPLGFYPQTYDESNRRDRWGMEGAYWQAHRSGWDPHDFGDEWEFICCKAFHLLDQQEQPLHEPFGALWAIRTFDAKLNNRMPKIKGQSKRDIVLQFATRYLSRLIERMQTSGQH